MFGHGLACTGRSTSIYHAAMLVMKRGAGESVLIGEGLLTVVRVAPDVLLQYAEGGRDRSYRFHGGFYKANHFMFMGVCKVVLMAVTRREVMLGFEAPKSVRILRTEILTDNETSANTPDQS